MAVFVGVSEFVVLSRGGLSNEYYIRKYRSLSLKEEYFEKYRELPHRLEDETQMIEDLLDCGLYKLLAQHVRDRDGFRSVGALRRALEQRLDDQKSTAFRELLAAVKTLKSDDEAVEDKRSILQEKINVELAKVRGF